MTVSKHIKLWKLTALISFIIGTLIFGIYYITLETHLNCAADIHYSMAGQMRSDNIISQILVPASGRKMTNTIK